MKRSPGGAAGKEVKPIMREVEGGVFLNEPSIGRIMEALRNIYNEGIAKECGVTLTAVTAVHKDTGETVRTPVRAG